MARSYEELVGSLGRGMFFRPERRRVSDLLSRDSQPKVRVDGSDYPVFDLSLNGLSFLAPLDARSWPISEVLELSLLLHGKKAYNGEARVARSELTPKGIRVGVSLDAGFLDLGEVFRLDEDMRLEQELLQGPAAVRAKVPAPYREAVERAAHFLQYYRRVLDRHERRHRADEDSGRDALESLAHRTLESLREPWAALDREATRASLECFADPAVLRAAKDLTETVVTPLLLDCPMVARSYGKPLGYPGDYKVMLFYYDNRLEGDSVYAKVLHKYFVEHPLSNGVRTRKELMVELTEREHERVRAKSSSQVFRATSLGCGPSREVAEYPARVGGWPGTVEWTLIDQEDEALAIAYHDARRALAKTGARANVQCLNLSFSQLLAEPAMLEGLPPQDLIYSVGLFDYLSEPRAVELVESLYSHVAPGGLLAIGNAIGPNEWFWSAEFVLDWSLRYRTREEMKNLARKLPENVEAQVVAEPGNAYYFLLVRRPG